LLDFFELAFFEEELFFVDAEWWVLSLPLPVDFFDVEALVLAVVREPEVPPLFVQDANKATLASTAREEMRDRFIL
jgi:hypothetical protein